MARLCSQVAVNDEYVRKEKKTGAGIATGYGLHDRMVGIRVPLMSRILTIPYRPEGLCVPPSLLASGYQGLFLGSKMAEA
jgi:hypothetical protein